MPAYAIPARYQDGFRHLVAFTDDDFDRLMTALAAAQPTLRVDQLTLEVTDAAQIDADKAAAALQAVYSAASLMARDDLSSTQVVAALETEPLGVDTEVFAARMGKLLGTEALRTSVRAVDLAVADERLMTTARIVTDIRPVFSPRGEQPPEPKAALLVHSLRVDYIEDGEQRTFSVMVDGEDMAMLRRVVDRATAKGEALVALIEGADLPYLRGAGDD
jgi:hypothetical protein